MKIVNKNIKQLTLLMFDSKDHCSLLQQCFYTIEKTCRFLAFRLCKVPATLIITTVRLLSLVPLVMNKSNFQPFQASSHIVHPSLLQHCFAKVFLKWALNCLFFQSLLSHHTNRGTAVSLEKQKQIIGKGLGWEKRHVWSL